jgi:proteic killer suppression protein
MPTVVALTRLAKKNLKKIPRHILIQLDLWIEILETEGLLAMQKINGYKDHPLTGDREGQRSSYLSRSWRVIYKIDEDQDLILIEILEVNHHDY